MLSVVYFVVLCFALGVCDPSVSVDVGHVWWCVVEYDSAW